MKSLLRLSLMLLLAGGMFAALATAVTEPLFGGPIPNCPPRPTLPSQR